MFLSSRCTHTPTQTPLQLAHGQLWDHRLQVSPPCRRERVELALDLLEMKVSAPVVRWIMDSGGADGVVEPLWNLWQDRRRRSNCESGPAQAVRQTPAKSLCNVSVALGKSAYLVHAAAQHTRSQPDVVSGGVSDSPALSLVKSVEEDWAAMLGTARREWVQSTAHGRAALRRQLRQAPEAGCPSERVVCVSSSRVGGAEEAYSAKVPLPKIHALEQRWATVSPPRRSATVANQEWQGTAAPELPGSTHHRNNDSPTTLQCVVEEAFRSLRRDDWAKELKFILGGDGAAVFLSDVRQLQFGDDGTSSGVKDESQAANTTNTSSTTKTDSTPGASFWASCGFKQIGSDPRRAYVMLHLQYFLHQHSAAGLNDVRVYVGKVNDKFDEELQHNQSLPSFLQSLLVQELAVVEGRLMEYLRELPALRQVVQREANK